MSNEDNPVAVPIAGLDNLPASSLQRIAGEVMKIIQARAYVLSQDKPDAVLFYPELDYSTALTAGRIVAFNTMGALDSKAAIAARVDSKVHTLVALFLSMDWGIDQMRAAFRAVADGLQKSGEGILVPDLPAIMRAAPDAFGGIAAVDAVLSKWEAQTNLALEAMANRVTAVPCDCPKCKERRGDLSYKATHEGGRA